jgi:methyltransferase
VSAGRYAAVLLAFGAQRAIELVYSARNERVIRGREPSTPQAGRSIFKWIALVNLGLFTLPALERWVRGHPPPRPIAAAGWITSVSALTLRLSVVVSLQESWNVRALVPADLRIVDRGPYRFIRHPNYVALALEFLGLPLIGGAYASAAGLSLANALLLRRRIREEEALLMAIPAYRERMAKKPAFLPRLFSGR